MSDIKKILWYLRKMPLVANLPAPALTQWAGKITLRESRRKDVFYLPGDPSDSLFLVHGGRIKISKVTRDGKSLTLAYCGPTEIFGENCLADAAPRAEMAETVDNAIVSECPRRDFEDLCIAYPQLALGITRIVVMRRRELEAKIESLIFRDVGAKLAELLLTLAEQYGIEDSRGTLLSLKITHQEMANLVGATRETVSLTLSNFKRQGIIDTEGRRMIVADVAALKALY
ncbi:MAG: Crp/Fnr family transcriptional regulator [Kofleriaceae bacterium]|nr:Crp/Fnr family transcriptional regulator [Kofleriaceae bacterium]